LPYANKDVEKIGEIDMQLLSSPQDSL
jgi:hypothetical protein